MPKLKQNMFHELEVPIIILSTKYHKHLGVIENIDPSSVRTEFNMNSYQEVSFKVHKELSGRKCTLWDSIVDLKYIFIPDYNEYYEIQISVSEDDKTVKYIEGRSACETELSQKLLRNFECNTETDIMRDDYSPTTFYNPDNENASLLHRVLHDKCPEYSIKHVDSTLANIQRMFSCDEKSVYDFLINDVAEEINCLFRFDSVNRTISAYDFSENCNSCHYRGSMIDSCPKCGETNIRKSYGLNTNVFISKENFADLITVEGDANSIKTCFKIEGGDDLMTATVANCNPNGSSYIYRFSDIDKADMPKELVEKIELYDTLYNKLKNDYSNYTGQLYETIDEELYLTSEMMPATALPETSAVQELNKLSAYQDSVSVQNINILSKTSADLAVNGMAKVIIDPRYRSEIISSNLSALKGETRRWSGKFKIINQSDETDTAESAKNLTISIIENDYEQYLYQKILKSLDKNDSLFLSVFEIDDMNTFSEVLKSYCLDSLRSFESTYQSCIEILIENGVTNKNSTFYGVDLYKTMYKPYYDRIIAIQKESVIRENQIAEVQKRNKYYSELRSEIQKQLDFRNYIGEDLWLIFCSYLREDTYKNDNYVSDGLSNTELIDRAKELFETAQNEIYKASELQVTLSSTLENLLSIKEFNDFKDQFDIGNWIICKVNDGLYKLRLINIGIDYGDLSHISVTFSNVEKMKGSVSDVRSILSSAKSMASSFNYVAHQAIQGKEANDVVEDYRKVGLDAALFNIMNCGTQDIVFDKHGITCRQYDDVLDDYLPEQLRIINNTIAFSSDNWKTVSCALGKLKYTIDGVEHEDYGLNADHVISGVMVSGHIYSGNYSSTNQTGTHINLNDGTFSFAGGNLTYKENKLSVKGDIIATGGIMGGWTIAEKAIYYGTNSLTSNKAGTYLGTDGIRQYSSSNQYVDIKNGTLTAYGATIHGDITTSNLNAVGGTIAGWSISSDGFSSEVYETYPQFTGSDVQTVQRLINGGFYEGDYISSYDINGDDKITIADLVFVQKINLNYNLFGHSKGKILINPKSIKETIVLCGQEGLLSDSKTVIGCASISSPNVTSDIVNATTLYTSNINNPKVQEPINFNCGITCNNITTTQSSTMGEIYINDPWYEGWSITDCFKNIYDRIASLENS